MTDLTQADNRITLTPDELLKAQSSGSLVLDSRLTRPLWFDGRFLAAKDLTREQNYFLARQADLGRAAGFGVVEGLWVETVSTGSAGDAETLIIRAGHGITPSGEAVMLPRDLTVRLSDLAEEQKLEAAFGISAAPTPPARTRTGLFVLALSPVEFTANPIASFPTSIQGNRTTHDGDVVEATAVVLLPFPDPVANADAAQRRAALARQIFVARNAGAIKDSFLPLAMLSIQRGTLEWADPYLVRRDSGPELNSLRFGLTDPAAQQAFLLQYDTQLQETVAARRQSNLSAGFSAGDYFRALPPAGRFPLASINLADFSQVFFPQQMDVRLSIVPEDELPALIEDSMSLPPIDLTLPAEAYANLAVFALVPVPRAGFTQRKASLPEVPLRPTLPQVLGFRQPRELLRLFQGGIAVAPPPPAVNNAWQQAIGNQTYGFYLRRRSAPVFVEF